MWRAHVQRVFSHRWIVALGALAAVALVLASPLALYAQEELDDQVRAIAAGLRCPVCQNLSVADSPSEMAREMRGLIRDQLTAGKTPDEVRAYFVSKYGDWILLSPRPRGLSLLVWLGPFAAAALGLAVAVRAARRWSRRSQRRERTAADPARRRTDWRNAGLYSAFLISLFTEMFGVPLTIYLIAPFLGLPSWTFGFYESHLWAFALERLGLGPLHWGVYAVMAAGVTLIGIGASLVAVGWATVYRGRARLVTSGIYAYLRHPQYVGLILVVVGFNVQWPTVLTLLMAPILVVTYVRLARREDRELVVTFGPTFLEYTAQTPAFVPWARPRRDPRRLAEGAPSTQAAVTTSVTTSE